MLVSEPKSSSIVVRIFVKNDVKIGERLDAMKTNLVSDKLKKCAE